MSKTPGKKSEFPHHLKKNSPPPTIIIIPKTPESIENEVLGELFFELGKIIPETPPFSL